MSFKNLSFILVTNAIIVKIDIWFLSYFFKLKIFKSIIIFLAIILILNLG